MFQQPSAREAAAWDSSRARQVGGSSRRWRLISRKSGSRMARETPAAFIPARRRRTATRSDSMAMPEQISSRPDKLRGKVRPLPMDLGALS